MKRVTRTANQRRASGRWRGYSVGERCAVPGQEGADGRGHRGRLGRPRRRGGVADRQVVLAQAHLRPGIAVLGGEAPPDGVDRDEGPGGVEDGEVGGERIEGALQEGLGGRQGRALAVPLEGVADGPRQRRRVEAPLEEKSSAPAASAAASTPGSPAPVRRRAGGGAGRARLAQQVRPLRAPSRWSTSATSCARRAARPARPRRWVGGSPFEGERRALGRGQVVAHQPVVVLVVLDEQHAQRRLGHGPS